MGVTASLHGNNGIDQRDRMLPALVDGYFNVDEMTFEDLLAASVEFAAELKYVGANLQASGDWRSFLASNEIAIMALIISKNTDQLHKQAKQARLKSLPAQAELVSSLLHEWNTWLLDLKRSNSVPARDLAAKLENIIRSSLRREAKNVASLIDSLRSANVGMPQIDLNRFSEIWREVSAAELEGDKRGSGNGGQNKLDPVQALDRVVFEFITATEHVKSHCRDLLPHSLQTQSHDPAVSLFITFLKLYRYAQDNLNSFTSRHLDFYYQKILRTQARKKSLESVIVNLSVPPEAKPVAIEKGRKFTCVKDEQLRDVVFEASEDLRVTDSEVKAMHTLRFEREKMITPECDMNFITRIHRQDIPVSAQAGTGQNGESTTGEGWPLFGEGKTKIREDADSGRELEIGLAVASKALFLDEGYRKIELDIALSRKEKPLSFYLEQLERSTNRAVFRHSLFAMLAAWLRDNERHDWAAAVTDRSVERIFDTARTIDRRTGPAALTVAGLPLPAVSCHQLLEETLEGIHGDVPQELPYLLSALHAETEQEFRDALGDLLVHMLLEGGDVQGVLGEKLDIRARDLGCETSLQSIKNEMVKGASRLCKDYFGTAFIFRLSTEEGWLEIDRYDVLDQQDDQPGLRLVLSLSADAPPIVACMENVHGANWNGRLPLLKMSLNPEASLNVYSLLEGFCLDRVTLNVEVSGARNIVAYNNISQLDPSKPFYPFGPLPTLSSYLAIASPEAAKKNVNGFRLHLDWGDLPIDEEGFDAHYQGYASRIRNGSFTANVSVLNNGTWQPQSQAQLQNVTLFESKDKKLLESKTINVEAAEYLRPVDMDAAETQLDLGLKTRNGFIKIALASPDVAFGHQEYPIKLSGTLEANAKKRVKKKSKLPNAPYTPLLNKISFDYSASSVLSLNAQGRSHEEKNPEQVYRLHAFGAEKIYPVNGSSEVQFLKPFDRDGNLLLGISGSNVCGLINLYFSLSDDSRRTNSSVINELHWSYLGKNGWNPLPRNRVVHDGTKGFLCSGIITFDLPEDICNSHADMPDSLFWLKVSSNAASSQFCSVRQVKTHALSLRRTDNDEAEFFPTDISRSALKWQPISSIPGLSQIEQLDEFTDVDQNETRNELITRVSERLRHRARAVNSWDYERLILERFPIVGKVMCLPNRSQSTLDAVPGNLLIVVTPRISDPMSVVGKLPRLSAVHLNDIREYVSRYCSAFASIEVANPVFEWVQVRCTAIFEPQAQSGLYIDRLDEDISRFLNPWDDTGYGLQFNRPVKREDLYSYIYNLDYMRYLTDFSMLHISRSANGDYRLGDTVYQEITGQSSDVTPLYPWSLLVPLQRHYIEVSENVEPITPDVTGIRELEIGSTFIVGGM